MKKTNYKKITAITTISFILIGALIVFFLIPKGIANEQLQAPITKVINIYMSLVPVAIIINIICIHNILNNLKL